MDVRSVKPYLMLSNESSPLLATGGTAAAVLTPDNVALDTNVVYEHDSEVQFTVVSEPVQGAVEVTDDDGRTSYCCRRFTLADVRRGSVSYRRNSSVDSGVERDRFAVVVRLDDLQTTGVVVVDLTRRPPTTTHLPAPVLEVRGSMTATVDELGEVVLTSDQLNAVVVVTSYPGPVDAGSVRYDVTEEPQHGTLSVHGSPVWRFTQANVDAGWVSYRHRDAGDGAESAPDSFQFQARHRDDDGGVLVSDQLEFVIEVVESTIPLSAGNLTVVEGQAAMVDAGALILADRYRHSADVVFSVVTRPEHGQLESSQRPGVRLTQFTGAQLSTGALRYVHDGDESARDHFVVSAQMTSPPHRRSAPATVHVSVIGVNDQPPKIVTNVLMKVWIGNSRRSVVHVILFQ